MTPLYPAKVIALFIATMVIAIGRLRAHHPFPRFGPANVVTTVRALLVATVAGFIGERHRPLFAATVTALAIVATVLDGVDGWFARRTRMSSAFGARFDMEVDALLMLALAILVWRYGKAGAWVLASGLLRYVFVAAGRARPWLRAPLTPSLRGRAICIIQVTALIVALMPPVSPPASAGIAAFGLVVLSYSFVVDTLWLWRHR